MRQAGLAEGKEAARGALQPARSPGAGLELFNNRLAVLEDLPALLAFERAVPALHRSWGVGGWAARRLGGDRVWNEREARIGVRCHGNS